MSTFYHSYSNVTIHVQVRPTDIQPSTMSREVEGFPFWLDTSSWKDGDVVQIAGNNYEISIYNSRWRAHRDFDDYEYENLYYHLDVGIFIESRMDRMTLGSYGLEGYTEDITITGGNLERFISIATGAEISFNAILLSGIFIEVLVILWLVERRRENI